MRLAIQTTLLTAAIALAAAPEARAQCWDDSDKLFASAPANFLRYGVSVALDGNTLAVGAYWNVFATGTGEVYLYERDGSGAWLEVGVVAPSDGSAGDRFGLALALDGSTLAVGAPDHNHGCQGATCFQGAVYVYERDHGGPGAWGEVAKLTGSDPVTLLGFGTSLDLSGDTLAVGSTRANGMEPDSGAAFLFERDQGGPGAWGEALRLVAADGTFNDLYGSSVAIDGDTLAVGALGANNTGAGLGAVYVYERDLGGPGAWGERAKLIQSDSRVLWLGSAVALQGDTLVAGADGTDYPLSRSGVAFVYNRDQGGPDAWGEVGDLFARDSTGGEEFGNAIALDGDLLIIGAPDADILSSNDSAGAAYVFVRSPGLADDWHEVAKLTSDTPGPSFSYGRSVSVSGGRLAVGDEDDGVLGTEAGAAFVVERGSLAPETYCTPGTSFFGCHAFLTACGTASASAASGFTVHALDVEGARDGTFFYSTNGRKATPWGNGTSTYCVVPPVVRVGVQSAVGTIGACDGVFARDLNALWQAKPTKNPGAGALVQAQFWYRDPINTSNQKTGFSSAIEFPVLP